MEKDSLKKDKKLIMEFVHDLYDWIETSFINNQSIHKWPVIHIRNDLRADAKTAWLQFKKDFPKETFMRSISHFQKKRLTAHGLYGAQLKYKLKIVKIAANEAKYNRQGWKIKMLHILDNLLESIGDGLPGYGALKELKDSLLVGINDAPTRRDGFNRLKT